MINGTIGLAMIWMRAPNYLWMRSRIGMLKKLEKDIANHVIARATFPPRIIIANAATITVSTMV